MLLFVLGCEYLQEQRTDPDAVLWSGYVLEDVSSNEDTLLLGPEGTLEVVDLDDVLLAEGEHSSSTEGYWFAEVPVATEVALRVGGPEHITSVWRTRTPAGRGLWQGGALFTQYTTSWEAFAEIFEGYEGLNPADLAEGEVVHIWGQPWTPDLWAGSSLSLIDETGAEIPVYGFAIADDGTVTEAGGGPVDFFFGANAAPGLSTFRVETADGTVVEEMWPTRGGDLITALYFSLGEL